MMRGIVGSLEKHHSVRILDEGVAAAVRFSHRYLAGRQLPDKAVSVLDTACARLALGQNSIPAAIEDATREIDDLAVQTRVLERETSTGADHAERLEAIAKRKADCRGAAQMRLNERFDERARSGAKAPRHAREARRAKQHSGARNAEAQRARIGRR